MFMSPSQLSTQLLNQVHATTGLPWWASIPLTVLAARTALLPLSAKAKSSSACFLLIGDALSKARLLRDRVREAETRDDKGRASPPKGLGMMSVSRGIYTHMRQQQAVPSLRWYFFNGAAQARTSWGGLIVWPVRRPRPPRNASCNASRAGFRAVVAVVRTVSHECCCLARAGNRGPARPGRSDFASSLP